MGNFRVIWCLLWYVWMPLNYGKWTVFARSAKKNFRHIVSLKYFWIHDKILYSRSVQLDPRIQLWYTKYILNTESEYRKYSCVFSGTLPLSDNTQHPLWQTQHHLGKRQVMRILYIFAKYSAVFHCLCTYSLRAEANTVFVASSDGIWAYSKAVQRPPRGHPEAFLGYKGQRKIHENTTEIRYSWSRREYERIH